MANLFWKSKKQTKNLLSTPFKTEEEFEKVVFETPEILEDIFLIKRQIRGGNKRGIPDIVGIDNDGNVCIIEMKNVTVDASIVPQVLEYAIWAETNPAEIRNLWLECKNKPDDLEFNNDYKIRLIVIAPSILRVTLDIVNKIAYPIDLIEIKRWVEGANHILSVNKLEPEQKIKTRLVSGLEVYDEQFYKGQYNSKSAVEFLRYIKEVEKIIKTKKWSLTTKYNKHYCGFKAGAFNAFGVKWVGSKTFAFFFKLSESEVKKIPIKMTKYENIWKDAVYYIDPTKTKTKDFLPLFEKAYKNLTG